MPTAPEGGKGGHGSVRDWSKIREEIEDKGLPVEAYPVVVGDEGPMWVPLDSKGVTCLIEVMEKERAEVTTDLECPGVPDRAWPFTYPRYREPYAHGAQTNAIHTLERGVDVRV